MQYICTCTYLVTKVKLIIQSKELELEAMAMRGQLWSAPPRNLQVIDTLFHSLIPLYCSPI